MHPKAVRFQQRHVHWSVEYSDLKTCIACMNMIEFFCKQFSKTLASDGMNDKQMYCLKYLKMKNYESISILFSLCNCKFVIN